MHPTIMWGDNMNISTMKKSREYLLREVIIGTILWIIMLFVLLKASAYTKSRLWNTSEMTVAEGYLKAKYNRNGEPIIFLGNGISYGFEKVMLHSHFVDIEEMLTYIDSGDYLQLIVYDGLEYNYIYALNCNGKECLTLEQTFKIFEHNYRISVYLTVTVCTLTMITLLYKIFCLITGRYYKPTASSIELRITFTGQIKEIKIKKGDHIKKGQLIMVADGKVGAITTHNLKIKAKMSGVVEKICVKEDDRVKTFEPLVIIRYK